MRLAWATSRKAAQSFFQSLLQDESGQSVTEYVLILSLSTAGAITFTRGFLRVLDQGMLRLGGQLEKDLKTGRLPANVWKD